MKNKIAIITGAGGGVGGAIAKLLDEQGILLALVDINRKGLAELAESLSQEPLCIEADITSLPETKRIITEAIEKFGKVDILINNAGIVGTTPFESRSIEDIERVMNVNYTAVSRLIREIIPHMKERGSGNIISVCSLAGILPIKESPVYVASKFAMRGLMISLNLTLREHGIGVTNICPNSIDTPMLQRESREGGTPLNFLADPMPASDVAKAVLKGIRTGKMEICVPWSDGIGSKFLGFFPYLIPILEPVLVKLSRKGHAQYLEKNRRDSNDE
jgi:short-subunit dehydrogenase